MKQMKRKFGFKNQKYNEQLASIPHNFVVTHDEENGVSELTIYGDIGESWWWESTSASDVDSALKAAGSHDLIIHLNSPGGSAFDGIAIYNRLKAHKGKVTINVDGWACSAASIIAMAADELNMGAGAMMMIHEASTIVWGSKTLMRKEAEMLEKLEDGIIDIYMTRANVEREEIRNMVNEETWFSANEAVEIGFATTTATTVKETEDDQLAQMKVQMQALQDQLNQIKNQPKEPEQKPAAVAKGNLSKLFLNLN